MVPPVHEYVLPVGTDKLILGLVQLIIVVFGDSDMVDDGAVLSKISDTLFVAVHPLAAVTVTW